MSKDYVHRYHAMVAEWDQLGHSKSACSGHTYPLPDCPAPRVHGQVFPTIIVAAEFAEVPHPNRGA